ncbi:helix-turn-helix domain-containing protein [Streptomyces yunnanensis]|uniref:helix-turn-helix domain-containing protein n=1 Tax=Streptomyces yunnanensis TaxID=156453 RepID=UPI003306CCC7
MRSSLGCAGAVACRAGGGAVAGVAALESGQVRTCRQAAKMFGVSQRSVGTWWRKYKAAGREALAAPVKSRSGPDELIGAGDHLPCCGGRGERTRGPGRRGSGQPQHKTLRRRHTTGAQSPVTPPRERAATAGLGSGYLPCRRLRVVRGRCNPLPAANSCRP